MCTVLAVVTTVLMAFCVPAVARWSSGATLEPALPTAAINAAAADDDDGGGGGGGGGDDAAAAEAEMAEAEMAEAEAEEAVVVVTADRASVVTHGSSGNKAMMAVRLLLTDRKVMQCNAR